MSQPLVIELEKPSPIPPVGAFAYLNSVPSKLAKIGGRRIQLASTHPDEEGEVIEVPELPGGLLQLPSTQQQMDSRLVELVDDPTFLLIGMYRALTAPTGPLSAKFFEQKPLGFKKVAAAAALGRLHGARHIAKWPLARKEDTRP